MGLRSHGWFIVRAPRSRVPAYSLRIGRVYDGNGFGVLVLEMMFFGMNLFMLLEVLRSFEGLFAYLKSDKGQVGWAGGIMGRTSQTWGLSGVCTER